MHLENSTSQLMWFYRPKAEVLHFWSQLLVFVQGARHNLTDAQHLGSRRCAGHWVSLDLETGDVRQPLSASYVAMTMMMMMMITNLSDEKELLKS